MSPPPSTGPAMLPSRNPVAHSPVARPRSSGGASRTSRAIEDTVNIVEPIPDSDRNSSSCQYAAENAAAPVVTATMISPHR